MLGKSYFMLGQFEKATAELETTLKLAPNDYDAEYTLGLAFLKQRQVPQAKQLFQRMIDRLGNKPQLRVLIGAAYRETGFLPESIEEFKAALAIDPRFPRVHYYLGLTYLYKDGASRIADAMKELRSSWRQIRTSTSPTFISAFFTSSTASGTPRSASSKRRSASNRTIQILISTSARRIRGKETPAGGRCPSEKHSVHAVVGP